MAESAQPLVRKYKKYCLQYYNSAVCPYGFHCTYNHSERHEIDLVAYLEGTDFILGEPPKTIRQCHYYKLGRCIFQDRCRYLHDNDDSLRNQSDQQGATNSQPSEKVDLPSTSAQADKKSESESQPNLSKELTQTNDEEHESDGTESSLEEDEEEEGACASPAVVKNKSWAEAPEFVPRGWSYAQVVKADEPQDKLENRKLCPYTTKEGICVNVATCNNVHGEFCDMCERYLLHPYNESERKRHQQECVEQHERNMEHSFAIQRSKEKTCGICFEIIMEKANGEQRFGILPNCNHCFCLTCIRKWRQAHQFENKIIRACPECRVTSDFVCPSMYWVDTKEDKSKLIEDYKEALSRKDCKYFKRGEGKCPFGNKCFYKHATPDGNNIDVGPPSRQRRHRHVDTELDVLQVVLWDFLDGRDFPWQSLANDLEDLVSFFTDSDESDWSDYELFLD
ncbi:hypothetical protein ABEB36_011072 [Hypothenemus hampei]|uniref:RING-type E3 ubiquitin transferase n=1 Tax=Hypothenemus hampei TaxID=57062 RepID=A0ABD1EG32_HYPHA